MKNKQLILTALAAGLLATGCKQSTSDENSMSDTNPPSTTENIKEGATNAWQKTKDAATNAWADVKESLGSASDYTYDKKDEFVTKAQADLDALDAKINDLSNKADTSLHDKRAALDQKLTDVKNATQDNWNDTKTAFLTSYHDVKNTVKQDWNGMTGSTTNTTAQ